MTVIMRRVSVAMLWTMLFLAEGSAEAEEGAAPTEIVLTGDELDRYQIEAGMLVEVIYGKGARHGFSGAWAKLVRVRGVVERVDWDRRQLVVAREEDEAKETVAVDRIQTMTVIGSTAPVDSRAQDEPGDSLVVKEGHRPFDIENRGLRVLTKVATGTGLGFSFTAISIKGLGERLGVGGSLLGIVIGCSIGFPLGVTFVDPYDSFDETLLAGVVPGFASYSLILLYNQDLLMYVFPLINSLIVSELSREPPQVRRVSFELAPAAKSGLYGSVRLHF